MQTNKNIDIRPIKSGEHADCADIYTSAWNLAFPDYQRAICVEEFETEIVEDSTLVAVIDQRVIGYISIWEPEWFIHHLYVDPLSHGNGVGTALISQVERSAAPHSISLKCVSINKKAMGFYEALGFTHTSDTGVDRYGEWVRLTKSLAF